MIGLFEWFLVLMNLVVGALSYCGYSLTWPIGCLCRSYWLVVRIAGNLHLRCLLVLLVWGLVDILHYQCRFAFLVGLLVFLGLSC